MNKEKAIEIIGKENLNEDWTFHISGYGYAHYDGGDEITLDGDFDIDELEAFIWCIKEHKTKKDL